MKKPQYLVIQMGARRNYAVPALLARNGMKGMLYTDLCGDRGMGKIIRKAAPSSLTPQSLSKLADRRLPEEILDRTTTFDRLSLQHQLRLKKCTTPHEVHREGTRYAEEMTKEMTKKGTESFTHVYSMFGEGGGFLEFAKQQGITVVTEVYLSPRTMMIVQELAHQFPELAKPYEQEFIDSAVKRWNAVVENTDHFIVPSKFVAETLSLTEDSENEHAILVPYCTPPGWIGAETSPQKGRVLFVGSAELRKGIHILGKAAELIDSNNITIRVAGNVTPEVKQHALTKKLHFLGRVPRTEIQQEFAQADVFVLPSFAEGSAEVVYEALSLGLPVITTHETGSVVRDGVEGLIIPSGDADALASAITRIVEDRELREEMSINARKRAENYSWDQYGKRLAHACEFLETPDF